MAGWGVRASVVLSAVVCASLALLGWGQPLAAADAAAIDTAVRFREELGLAADRAHVASTFGDERYSDDRWGVPLSDAELEELNRRVRVQRSTAPVMDWAVEQSEFGGAYFDQLRDGVPVFLVTDDPVRFRARLGGRVPDNVDYEVRVVERSRRELLERKAAVSDARQRLQRDGIELVSVEVHIKLNRVEVTVLDRTQVAVDAIHRIDPDAVVKEGGFLQLDACNNITNCRPIKGGIKIEAVGSGVTCTSGYMARRTDGSHDDLGIVTAGHCIYLNNLYTSNNRWQHHSDPFGTEKGHAFQVGSYGDVGWIQVDAEELENVSNLNRVLVKPSDGSVQKFTSQWPAIWQIEGTLVCRIGWGSWYHHDHADDGYPANPGYLGRKCGDIVIEDADAGATNDDNSKSCVMKPTGTEECRWIRKMKVVSFDSWRGDSGGPVFQQDPDDPGELDVPAALFGTHVHSKGGNDPDKNGWYSAWSYGSGALQNYTDIDIWPCLDAACTAP